MGELSNAQTTGVSSLDSGHYWNLSTDREITYSFNLTRPGDYTVDHANGWAALNEAQKIAVRTILAEIGDLLNISFIEVADTTAYSDGDIQFNITHTAENVGAYAYYPSDRTDVSYYGDVFLSSKFNTSPDDFLLNAGEWGWMTIAHETGHALGLKHPFEGANKLPADQDNTNHTIMSYTSSNNLLPEFTITGNRISFSAEAFHPELLSLYDVATLQSHYGVNLDTNTGNTTYQYQYTDYQRNTIWDAGGVDKIDLSMCIGSSSIDLNAGSLNSVDQYTTEQIIKLHQDIVGNSGANDFIREQITKYADEWYTGKDNLGIATGAIIENLTTGSGNDTIIDNLVDNLIEAGAGDDKIYIGNGGYDTISGGTGSDAIYINSDQAGTTYSNDGSEYAFLYSDNFSVKFKGIESLIFNDGTVLV